MIASSKLKSPLPYSFTVTGSNGNDQVKMTAAEGKTLTLAGLPTLGGEVLDLATGDLKVTGVTATAVEALLKSAREGTVRWQGPGIGTSSATNFTGLSALQSGADVVVKYTYNGDANQDGRVNSDDYFRIDSAFLAQPANPTYNQGDFNFDDTVNSDDYFLIDSAFLGQGTPLAAASAAATASVTSSVTETVPAIPENEGTKRAKRVASDRSALFGSTRIQKRVSRR